MYKRSRIIEHWEHPPRPDGALWCGAGVVSKGENLRLRRIQCRTQVYRNSHKGSNVCNGCGQKQSLTCGCAFSAACPDQTQAKFSSKRSVPSPKRCFRSSGACTAPSTETIFCAKMGPASMARTVKATLTPVSVHPSCNMYRGLTSLAG